MKSVHLFSLLLVAVALMLGACANPADDKPEAVVEEPSGSTGQDDAPGREFVLDPSSSEVEFTGSKVTGSHTGGFRTFEGAVVLVDGDPTKSRVDVTIDTTSMWSDNDRLTGHLKSPDFFEVETYPTAEFNSTAIAQTDTGYSVTGDLTLHGVTKQVTFPASITVAEDRIDVDAEFVVMRFDFGIEYPGKPDDLIRDEVVIRLDLTAVPAGAAAEAA